MPRSSKVSGYDPSIGICLTKLSSISKNSFPPVYLFPG